MSANVSQRGATTGIFVYGTLLKGMPNHRLLASAKFVGLARTTPGFALYDLGGFPGMTAGHGVVEGEVYVVDPETLAVLDRLENHPKWYRRQIITLDDGTTAETYLMPSNQVAGRPVITSGSWRQYRHSRTT